MNEQQYHALCKTCDRLLLAPDSTVERVAISWLHVIREHPVFLENYEDLFEVSRGAKGVYENLFRILRNKAGLVKQLGKPLFSKNVPWYGPKDLPSDVDFLFVSHLLNPSQADDQFDFYFGNVPEELYSAQRLSVIALINHSSCSGASLTAKWDGSFVPRVVLSEGLRLAKELELLRRLIKESFGLRRLARKNASLFRRVARRSADEAVSAGSLGTLRMFEQFRLLVNLIKPKAIVVTHEGHAWERLAFAAARVVCPDVCCVGYQHAALFRLQHAIRRNLAGRYNPDHILTAGPVGKAQLEKAKYLKGIPVSVLGSNRSVDRNESPVPLEKNPQSDKPVCLVMPEGIPSECHLLFNFSLACAKKCPDIRFIWRLHPIVDFESLAEENPRLKKPLKNIFFSESILEDDIRQCQWVLYRGTTAVVPAVIAGLRPIYLRLSKQLNIDPLYGAGDWRFEVKSVEGFARVIRNTGSENSDGSAERNKAEAYCRDFFSPLKPSVLESAVFSS